MCGCFVMGLRQGGVFLEGTPVQEYCGWVLPDNTGIVLFVLMSCLVLQKGERIMDLACSSQAMNVLGFNWEASLPS